MNEIQLLLQQYKGVVEKLEIISKNYDELQEFKKIKEESKNIKRELEEQKKKNDLLRNDNRMLMGLLRQFNKIEICRDCDGAGGFDDGYGGGCSCDKCKGQGFINLID